MALEVAAQPLDFIRADRHRTRLIELPFVVENRRHQFEGADVSGLVSRHPEPELMQRRIITEDPGKARIERHALALQRQGARQNLARRRHEADSNPWASDAPSRRARPSPDGPAETKAAGRRSDRGLTVSAATRRRPLRAQRASSVARVSRITVTRI